MTIIALLQARNEERFLPGWLENIAPCVDGIVALDDGSTDATADLLVAHPKVLEVIRHPVGNPWRERDNHIALIKAGRRHGASWFLCIDADERIELRLKELLPGITTEADRRGVDAFTLRLREMWDDDRHYRIDGVWGTKARYRLFRNNPTHSRFDPRQLHRNWMPLEIIANLAKVGANLPYSIYHLRMIDEADRVARHARYKALDPDNKFQSEGYDYLIDETGIELEPIAPEADFLLRT